jgi:hypothetical protein
MTNSRWRFPWIKRGRGRRAPLHRNDPSAVFKTFVQVLAQLHATSRTPCHAPLAASHPEKA